MQFKRVKVMVRTSMMNSSPSVQYEHMIPVLQVIRGVGNVTELEPDDRCGLVCNADGTPIDFSLEQEWARMMEKARMVRVGESQMTPAPLVAFPRGVRDLEDFYERLRRPRSVPLGAGPATPAVDDVEQERTSPLSRPMELDQKELRRLTKENLDRMGVDYKGNASTESLVALLDEVTAANHGQSEVEDVVEG